MISEWRSIKPVEINQYDIIMATHYDITMVNDIARDVRCEITMANDVARDIHCDVTLSNDVAMCTYHDITIHNDVLHNNHITKTSECLISSGENMSCICVVK